jgi:hypothetical protein
LGGFGYASNNLVSKGPQPLNLVTNVGIGDCSNPLAPLHVNGSAIITNQLQLPAATGTAPLLVTSTTVCSNLNSALLGGQDSSFYTNATNMSQGTLSSNRLPLSGVSAGTFGSPSNIPVLTIDSTGRITSASSTSTALDPYSSNTSSYASNAVVSMRSNLAVAYNATVGGSLTVSDLTVTRQASTTAAATTVQIRGDVAQDQGLEIWDTACRWRVYKPASSTDLRFRSGTTDALALDATGNLTCIGDVSAFGNLSDRRLKEAIASLPDAECLDMTRALRPVRFSWRMDACPNATYAGSADLGLIAQEVQEVVPEAVKHAVMGGGDLLTIKHERLVPLLIGAVRELSQKVARLEQEASAISV